MNEEENVWIITHIVQYGSAIYIAKFKVSKKGEVEILESETILENLPIQRLTIIGGFYLYEDSV